MNSPRKYESVQLKLLGLEEFSYGPALKKFVSEFEVQTGASVELVALPPLPETPLPETSQAQSSSFFGWWFLGWWLQEPMAQNDVASGSPQFDLLCGDNELQHALWSHLLPLNDLIAKLGYDMNGFFPPIYKYGERVAGQHGLRFGLPIRMRVPFVYYRTDLVGEFPGTWEEFDRALAENTGGDMYGLAMDAAHYPFHPFGYAHETTRSFLARYWSLGDPLFSHDWKPLIDSDKGIAALEMLRRQMSRYGPPDLMTWNGARALEAFLAGKVAILEFAGGGNGYSALISRLQDSAHSKVRDKWSIGVYPGTGTAPLTFHTLSIFKHCQNPEAAFEFIAYCTGAEGAQRLHLEYGENSARRSVMTSPEAITKDPSVLRRVLALEQGRPASAPVPQWLDLLVALWEAVQFCLLGYLPAQAALSRAAEKWTKLLKQSPPQWEYWE